MILAISQRPVMPYMIATGIKIHCTDKSVKIVESYEEVQTAWWNYKQFISHIEVIDAKKQSKPRGFQ